MSAFQIFLSIYAERVPQDTPALMKYGSIVKELATLGANWKFYDENFRKLRESQGVPWNQVHSELWLRSHSFRAKPNTQQRKSKIDGPFIPKGYCWKFHRNLHCPGCSFKHQCFRCGQSHPIAKCPQPKPHPGQRTKPWAFPLFGALPTPVKVERLAYYLEGYNLPLYEELLSGFLHGFCLHFYGPELGHVSTNLPSAAQHPEIVDSKLAKEVLAGRVLGPLCFCWWRRTDHKEVRNRLYSGHNWC